MIHPKDDGESVLLHQGLLFFLTGAKIGTVNKLGVQAMQPHPLKMCYL